MELAPSRAPNRPSLCPPPHAPVNPCPSHARSPHPLTPAPTRRRSDPSDYPWRESAQWFSLSQILIRVVRPTAIFLPNRVARIRFPSVILLCALWYCSPANLCCRRAQPMSRMTSRQGALVHMQCSRQGPWHGFNVEQQQTKHSTRTKQQTAVRMHQCE
jgi:hypothetical protein